ncbi:MAG: MFS transporter [Chloroflexota bacterium]
MFKNQLRGMKAFYALILGQIVSTVGSGMTRFGVGIWVFTETGNAAAYSTLLFFAVLPLGLGSLVAGPIVDRFDRKRIMITANIVASLSTLVIASLYFTDNLAQWHLYLALAINGVANSFVVPAINASVPLMVAKEKLGQASGLTQLVQAAEAVLAPAIAGIIFGTFGLGAIFIADFVTFTISIIALLIVLIPSPTEDDEEEQINLWRDFVMGLRTVANERGYIVLMGFGALAGLLPGGFGYGLVTPLMLTFSTEEIAGLVIAMMGVGVTVGSIGLAATGGPARRMNGILLATAGSGIGMMVISLRESAILGGLGFLIIGLSLAFIMGLPRVIFQTKAPPIVLGRIFSIWTAITVTTQSAGILLAGPVAERFIEPLMIADGALATSFGELIGVGDGRGMALIFLLSGCLLVVITLIATIMPSVRLLEDRIPDYEPDEKRKRNDAEPTLA